MNATITTTARRITRTVNEHAGRGELLGFDAEGNLVAVFGQGVIEDDGQTPYTVHYLTGTPARGERTTQASVQELLDAHDTASREGLAGLDRQERVVYILRSAAFDRGEA
jgi:hypothetical protein